MIGYLESLSEREKRLLSLMGIVIIIAGTYLAIYRPLVAADAVTERSLQAAEHVFKTVEQAAQLAKQAGKNSANAEKRNDSRPVRVIVAVEARENGVNISRTEPGEDGGVTMWVEAVAPQIFYGWVTNLQEKYGLSPEKVSLQKTGTEDAVRVQIQFGSRTR